MHWVLIILMNNYSGYDSAVSSQMIPGFTTQEACTAQIDWLKTRTSTRDAYCVYVK
jgi:hypothetical protein